MFISGFHIDGFGVYCDQGVQNLPLGLVLFAGDNESGKSTLMEFFRTMLFGMKRKGGRNDYQPVRGGGHGGRLGLALHDGRLVTVERLGKQAAITTAEGRPLRGEPAEELLGGIDRTTFEHIFAIGLTELQGLGVLDQAGVKGRLFSAGAGLGAASVPDALKAIDGDLGRLWAPRSKKLLTLLTDRLRELARDLKDLQGQAAAYAACQRQLEEMEIKVAAKRAEAEVVRGRLRRLDQLERAREPWAVLLTAGRRVEELGEVKDFPPNGLEQLQILKGDLEKIRLNLVDRQGEVARIKERLQEIVVDEALLAQREVLESLFGEREKIATASAQLPALQAKVQQADEEFQRQLLNLGTAWDAERLKRVETSVTVRQQVQDFVHRLDSRERRTEQLESRRRFLEEEAEEARERLAEANRRLSEMPAPAISDPGEVRQKQEQLRHLRTLLHRRELLEAQLQDRRLRWEDAADRKGVLEKQLAVGYDPIPWWIGLPVVMMGFVLATVLSGYHAHLAGNLTFLGGLAVAGLIYLGRWRLVRLERHRRTRMEEEAGLTEAKIETLAGETVGLETEMLALDKERATLSLQAADSPVQPHAQLDRLAADLDQAAQYLQAWLAQKRKSTDAREHEEGCLIRLNKARLEAAQALQELQDLQGEWRAWLEAWGFSGTVRPPAFEAVLQAVARAREAHDKAEDSRLRLRETEAYLEDAHNRVQAVLEACGRTAQGKAAGVADLDALRRDLIEALESRREQRELQHALASAQDQAARFQGLGRDKEAELQGLLARAGAADEEDFHRLAGLSHDRRDWLKRLEQNDIALLNIAGNPEAQRDLMEELRHTDVLALQGEREQLTVRLDSLEESIPRDDQELGRLKEQLSRMARDEKLGDLLQEESVLEEQLRAAMRRWAMLALSRHLLETAQEVYERERQPQVIREADRFLKLMTADRYRLVSSMGEHCVQLEDRAFKRKEQTHWSDGLADQVYLSVRLGLAREFSRHAEPLPIILDDVLVKFDPRRRRGAARLILEFARDQQVLLFTCHPEFLKIIADLHQDDDFRDTSVAYFHLIDGIIRPMEPEGPA